MRYLSLLCIAFFFVSSTQAQDTEWETIERFSGNSTGMSTEQTRPFTVEADEWRAKWNFRKKQSQIYASLFQVNLKRPGEEWEGDALASMANEDRKSNTTYRYESGRYYLEIQAMNGRWELKIQVPTE